MYGFSVVTSTHSFPVSICVYAFLVVTSWCSVSTLIRAYYFPAVSSLCFFTVFLNVYAFPVLISSHLLLLLLYADFMNKVPGFWRQFMQSIPVVEKINNLNNYLTTFSVHSSISPKVACVLKPQFSESIICFNHGFTQTFFFHSKVFLLCF